jgi:hypothetical protein
MMTLNIECVRPALFDQALGLRIEELMKFRHVFRNIYKSPLVSDFKPYHQQFPDFLQVLILELDGDPVGDQ